MADFISALTGVQMDQALMDMAEHNSEAYAVGERNGIAVASDDVTYHNNARYYAQIASSQIVGDASSAVRWDTDQSEVLTDAQKAQARENINAASDSDVVKITAQTLTSAEQAQARANIAAGGSNRNLLDNPWWGSGEVVNQRNTQSKPSNGSYTIDRWILTSGADANQWAIGANGITFTIASSSIWYTQRTPNPSAWSGKTLTASVLLSDGTIKSGSAVVKSGQGTQFFNSGGLYAGIDGSGHFVITVSATQTIRAVKLELGSVSTLANDAPPDYGEELANCQRYYYRITGVTFLDLGAALAETATAWLLRFPLPVPMRVAPTTAVSGNFVLWNGSTGNACSGISTHTAVTPPTNPAYVAIKGTSTGMTVGNRYNIQARNQASAFIEFSADL